jgi:hypothetical protein
MVAAPAPKPLMFWIVMAPVVPLKLIENVLGIAVPKYTTAL